MSIDDEYSARDIVTAASSPTKSNTNKFDD